MKINCVKCGKRFDAEKHMYICPKCNHYHSQVGAHRAAAGEKSVIEKYKKEESKKSNPLEGGNKTEKTAKKRKWQREDIPEYEKRASLSDIIDEFVCDDGEAEQAETLNGNLFEEPEKNYQPTAFDDASDVFKKIRNIVTAAIAIIMLISMVVSAGDDFMGDHNYDEDDWSYNGYSYYEVDYGEPMDFKTFTVNVGAIGEPDIAGLKCSNGCKLIQIDYYTEEHVEDDSVDSDVALIYEGEWYYALYEDELSKKSVLQDELWDAGLQTVAHGKGDHIWIFEVPEDADCAELEVTSYVSDDPNGWAASYEQDEQYIMQIELP